MTRIAIVPAPSEDEAAALFAVLAQLAQEESPPPEKLSRWRLAARTNQGRLVARAPRVSAWAQAGRRYE